MACLTCPQLCDIKTFGLSAFCVSGRLDFGSSYSFLSTLHGYESGCLALFSILASSNDPCSKQPYRGDLVYSQ